MRTLTTILLALSLAACGGKSNPAPAPTDDDTAEEQPDEETGEPAMLTPEECEGQGGMVKGDIGDGSVACDEGDEEVGHVSGGVEAQLCCVPSADEGE